MLNEINDSECKSEKLKVAKRSLNEIISGLSSKSNQKQLELTNLENDYKAKVDDLNDQIRKKRDLLHQSKIDVTVEQTFLKCGQDRYTMEEEYKNELKDDHKKITQKKETLEEEVEDVEADAKKSEKKAKKLAAQRDLLKMQIDEVKEELSKFDNEISTAHKDLFFIKKEQMAIQAQIKSTKKEIEKVNKANEELTKMRDEWVEKYNCDLKKFTEVANKLRERIAELEKESEEKQLKINKAQDENMQMQEKIHKMNLELMEAQEKMKQNYDEISQIAAEGGDGKMVKTPPTEQPTEAEESSPVNQEGQTA